MKGYAQAVINQDATVVVQNGNVITVSEAAGQQWGEFESDDPTQPGDHEWVGIDINTGESDITKVKFNGTLLSQKDVDDATSLGLPAGHFVLWAKADDTSAYPRRIVLGTEGKEDTKITVEIIEM